MDTGEWVWDPRSDLWWHRETGIVITGADMPWELTPVYAAHWPVPLSYL